MFIPDGDVDDLARDMIKHFPADSADQATVRSNAFFVLGYPEKSKKWLLVAAEIKKIQAGGATRQDDVSGPKDVLPPRKSSPLDLSRYPISHPAATWGEPDVAQGEGSTETRIPVLIAMVAWSELLWVLLLRA
jgi:hypothetical protein